MHVPARWAPTTNWSRIRTRRAELVESREEFSFANANANAIARVHAYTLLNARISSVHFHVQLSAFTSLSLGKHYHTRELGSSCSSSVERTKHERAQPDRQCSVVRRREIFRFYFVSRNRLFSRERKRERERDRCACTRSLLHARATRARLGNFVWRNAGTIYIYIYV